MPKAKDEKDRRGKQQEGLEQIDLFNTKEKQSEEINSDGSANAFEETERVDEDNFDKLSEK